MNRIVSLVALSFLLVACGKNEAIRQAAPNTPTVQAPAPSQPIQPPPGGGNGGGGFNPQMPQGYPNAYYPFLPIDNYCRDNPTYANQWDVQWNQWTNYSNYYGYSQYDFNRFWFEYCPQYWTSAPMGQLYEYFDTSFYFWVNVDTQFASTADPNYFWSSYR